jgi:hypothetical protein
VALNPALSLPLHPDRPPPQGDPETRFRLDIVDWFTVSDCLDRNERFRANELPLFQEAMFLASFSDVVVAPQMN